MTFLVVRRPVLERAESAQVKRGGEGRCVDRDDSLPTEFGHKHTVNVRD
jgi:hypothetical protein